MLGPAKPPARSALPESTVHQQVLPPRRTAPWVLSPLEEQQHAPNAQRTTSARREDSPWRLVRSISTLIWAQASANRAPTASSAMTPLLRIPNLARLVTISRHSIGSVSHAHMATSAQQTPSTLLYARNTSIKTPWLSRIAKFVPTAISRTWVTNSASQYQLASRGTPQPPLKTLLSPALKGTTAIGATQAASFAKKVFFAPQRETSVLIMAAPRGATVAGAFRPSARWATMA